MGQSTGYLREYLTGTREFDQSQAEKIRQFFSHTILDNWTPHFTLLNPYLGLNADGLLAVLEKLSKEYQELVVDSACLGIQERDGANWFIYKELFRR